MKAKPTKLRNIIGDFANWSTIAAISKMGTSITKKMFVFWSIILLIMCAAFFLQFWYIIKDYLGWPANVATTIKFEEQEFPQVSFCNFNPYKLSVVSTNPDFAEIYTLVTEYGAMSKNQSTTDTYGLLALSPLERIMKARDLLQMLAAKLTNAQKEPALYSYNEIVTECMFAGETCGPDNFVAFIDNVYGRCFTFVSNHTTIEQDGSSKGLRMILTVNQQESANLSIDFLPMTTQSGVRMSIHAPEDYVHFATRGIDVQTGYQTAIGIIKSQTKRTHRPYGHCLDVAENGTDLYSAYNYTLDACLITCMQAETVKKCGCANPKYFKSDDAAYCSTASDADCLRQLRGDELNTTDPNMDEWAACHCSPSCWETRYDAALSTETYPSVVYTVGVGTTQQNQALQSQQGGGRPSTTTATSTKPPSTTTRKTAKTKTHTSTSTSTTTTTPASDTTTPDDAAWTRHHHDWTWMTFPDDANSTEAEDTTVPTTTNATTKTANRTTASTTTKKTTTTTTEATTPDMTTTTVMDCTAAKAAFSAPFSLYHVTGGASPPWTLTYPLAFGFSWLYLWPCFYTCDNGTTFPTAPSVNMPCSLLSKCFNFNPIGWTTVPSWNNWNQGGNPCCQSGQSDHNDFISCSGGKKKREVDQADSVDEGVDEASTSIDLSKTDSHEDRVKRDADDSSSSLGAHSNVAGVGSCEDWNMNFESVQACKQWYKRNGLIVNIFFTSLNYQLLTEGASYTLSNAVNDLGGQAGLWLGLSVISVIECGWLFVMLITFCVSGGKWPKFSRRRKSTLEAERQ